MYCKIETDVESISIKKKPENQDKIMKILYLFLGAVFFFGGLLCIIMGIYVGTYKIVLVGTGIIFILVGIVVFAFGLFIEKIKEKLMTQYPKKSMPVIFEIDDTQFIHTVKEENGQEKRKITPLSSLTKAIEDAEFFKLDFTALYFIKVPKTSFVQGTPEELREKLKSILGNKFKFSVN